MSNALDQDKCIKCGEFLPCVDQRPAGTPKSACPKCGSMGRIKNASMHMEVSVNIVADAQLIIGWQEVDRLLEKAEYAAALLVAAVNVEFILWEKLRRFTPNAPPPKSRSSERNAWERIQRDDRNGVGLGSLIGIALYFASNAKFELSPSLTPFGWPLNEARKQIAHKRGFFAQLARLEEPDWSESDIRRILDAAKAFCHGNAP